MSNKLPIPKPGILDIAPYVGGKSSAAGAQKVIKLSSNETPLGPSPKAIAAYEAAEKKLHRYPDGNATGLREAIAKAYNIEPERIVCGAGSDEIIGLLVHAYAGQGDEVLYSEHGFLMYKIYAQSNGATPVTAPEKNLTFDVDALLNKVTPRTKIIFLANPNNPTGTYIPTSEVKRLRANLREDIILAIDAAYAEYVTKEDYTDGIELVRNAENIVMLRTFSKIHGLPALRLGWGYMPTAIAAVLNRIRGPFNVSSPAIAAGIAAIEDTSWVEKSIKHNQEQMTYLEQEFKKLGLDTIPSQGNFILTKFANSGAHTAEKANEFLLSQGIIVREVANYGLPEYLRITIGLAEENQALAQALTRFLKAQ